MKNPTPTVKKLYAFKGAVQKYDKIVANNFSATTLAPSLAKARSNIAYQYRMQNGLERFVPITLLGEVVVVKG